MSFGKLGARGGFGSLGVLGTAGKPIGLTNFKAAIAAANAGTGPRKKIVIVSDSTSMGTGAGTGGTLNQNGAYPNGWVPALATKLKAIVPTCFNTLLNSQAASVAYGTYDIRASLGANWAPNTLSFGGSMFKYTVGAVNNLTFTPNDPFDTIVFPQLQISGQGTATINIDGGSSLGTLNFANAANRFVTQTFTVPKGTHTINIVPNNDAGFFLPMIQTFDSTTPAIDVIQAGSAGATAATFIGNAQPWQAIPFLTMLAPVLTIICLTINDSNGGTALATYQSQLQTIITAAKLSGDVLLMVGIPSNTAAATNGTLDTYIAVVNALAASNGCSVVNMKAKWGSFANIQPTFTYFDALHSLQPGYQGPPANGFNDVSTEVFNLLRAA